LLIFKCDMRYPRFKMRNFKVRYAYSTKFIITSNDCLLYKAISTIN